MTRSRLNRRAFLLGSAALATLQLTGCSRRDRFELFVQLLEESVPSELIQEFMRQLDQPDAIRFEPLEQLTDAFRELQQWNAPELNTPIPHWVSIGDYWLAAAIQQQIIQPIPAIAELNGWQSLSPRWQSLVTRNTQGAIADGQSDGEIWGAPYRWGSLMLVYRTAAFEALDWTPTQWSDLWRSELEGRVSVLDSPRATIGIVLKQLGYSPNQLGELDSAAQDAVRNTLRTLHQNLRFYSSDAYLEPLLTNDTWLALGWSTDILPLLERDRRLAAVIPATGTILSADVWVHPANAPAIANGNPLPTQWLDFCWTPDIAERLTSLSFATSPILQPTSDLAATLRETQPLLMPDASILDNSDGLEPLPTEAIAAYQTAWTTMRQA
jgi:putative spermidine/putrescine transport system substrate-binding protein